MIKFEYESDSWRAQLRACVEYTRNSKLQAPIRNYGTDLCIITALASPEYDAVTRLNWDWGAAEPLDDTVFVRRGRFICKGTSHSVAAVCCSRMGMVSAALLTAKVIEREVPRFVVMPGICAAVEGKANFGDIIVGDPIWDWQSGKHFVDVDTHEFAIAPDPVGLSSFVRTRFEQMRADKAIWNGLRELWPAPPPETELKLRVGPMASGSAVLADAAVTDRIVEQNRLLLGIEMEAFGVLAAAVSAAHPRPTAFVCKSVCDFANSDKNDMWQAFAAYTSANAMRVFFETYMSEISELAGTR